MLLFVALQAIKPIVFAFPAILNTLANKLNIRIVRYYIAIKIVRGEDTGCIGGQVGGWGGNRGNLDVDVFWEGLRGCYCQDGRVCCACDRSWAAASHS